MPDESPLDAKRSYKAQFEVLAWPKALRSWVISSFGVGRVQCDNEFYGIPADAMSQDRLEFCLGTSVDDNSQELARRSVSKPRWERAIAAFSDHIAARSCSRHQTVHTASQDAVALPVGILGPALLLH